MPFIYDEVSADEDLDTRRRLRAHIRKMLAKLRARDELDAKLEALSASTASGGDEEKEAAE